ncbi:unnamed protein product [Candida verbasci]|uniref:Ribosomal lysine N-methyltransferase 3 n=1 Tax=Candida verbasci TaxID=1227364 RepID=A0A9W4TUR6_9ASCO|nr:unnamed protein product [Candida verbasci]
MSFTKSTKVESLINWLDQNTYWRDDLIIKNSKFGGGLGVFINQDYSFNEDDDKLLLRIPKTNLLNPKNSFIYNLLIEFDSSSMSNSNSNSNSDVILSEGMYGLVLTLIYEESIQENSPWFDYINSINIEDTIIPICLWDDNEKELLKNTEVDLLSMLNYNELINFYIECIKFAKLNEKLINIPSVLDISQKNLNPQKILNLYHDKLILFGKYIQSVVSRAFQVDNYYQLSLVPGADLFNHLQPKIEEGNKLIPQENIHFTCDGSVCDECGEQECDHEESADEDLEEFEELEELEELEDEELEDESDSTPEIEDEEIESKEIIDGEPEIKEITMEYINQIELEDLSDNETDLDPEEVSTLSMDEEDQHRNNENINIDLANDLSDSSKCCDVILVRPPLEKYDYEIFNSYGNELNNAYLLQKYGFINTNENFNNSCLLSVQFFKQISLLKEKLNTMKRGELQEKLDWLEDVGYELIYEIILSTHHHDEQDGDEQDEDEQDEDNHQDCCSESEYYENWPLSIRIKFNGEVTLQTYAILKLIELKYTIFKYKLLNNIKKLKKYIKQILLTHNETDLKSMNNTVLKWCKDKLNSYTPIELIKNSKNSKNSKLIKNLVEQEQNIINRFIDQH